MRNKIREARDQVRGRVERMFAESSRVLRSRLGKGRRGRIEIEAQAQILPVLSRQLTEASRDMESEVSRVCQSFQGMATKAMATVQNTSRILEAGAEGGADLSSVMQGCRETMVSLLDAMERGAELSQRVVRRMELVEDSVTRVGKVLEELDRSAFASKIIALNARIEASHLGEAGRGFEPVAEEISAQAERSASLTVDVQNILAELVNTARDAVGELRLQSTLDQARSQENRQDIHRMLAAIETANKDLRVSLEAASQQSGEVAKDITAALINLQFQDRVNQRIQHVVESLDSMHKSIAESQSPDLSPAAEERHKEIATQLASSYTMDCERVIHGSSPETANTESDGGDVELF